MTATPEQLAARVRGRGLDMSAHLARAALRDWEARGIAEQHLGGWRLTASGRAMLSAWVDDDDSRA